MMLGGLVCTFCTVFLFLIPGSGSFVYLTGVKGQHELYPYALPCLQKVRHLLIFELLK